MPTHLDTIPGALDDLRARVGRLEQSQAAQTQMLAGIAETVTTIRDLQATGRVATKGLKWIGTMAGAGAAIWSAIYMLTHGGHPPGK